MQSVEPWCPRAEHGKGDAGRWPSWSARVAESIEGRDPPGPPLVRGERLWASRRWGVAGASGLALAGLVPCDECRSDRAI